MADYSRVGNDEQKRSAELTARKQQQARQNESGSGTSEVRADPLRGGDFGTSTQRQRPRGQPGEGSDNGQNMTLRAGMKSTRSPVDMDPRYHIWFGGFLGRKCRAVVCLGRKKCPVLPPCSHLGRSRLHVDG